MSKKVMSADAADGDFLRCCTEKGNYELHCDSCLTWFHLKCAKMSRLVFKVLADLGNASAWFCANCVVSDGLGPKLSLRRLENIVGDIPSKFSGIINSALNDFKAKIKAELKLWISEEIKNSNDKLHEVEVMAAANKVSVCQIQEKLTKIAAADIQATVPQHLLSSIDKLERQARRGDIVIQGIPDFIPEADLSSLVISSANFLELPCTADEVSKCIRLKRKGSVLVTFKSIAKRDQLMKKYFACKNLTLKDVHPTVQIASRIFFNDNLTPNTQKLYVTGKELVKKNLITRVYLRRGGVFVVPLGDSAAFQIWSEADFPVFSA